MIIAASRTRWAHFAQPRTRSPGAIVELRLPPHCLVALSYRDVTHVVVARAGRVWGSAAAGARGYPARSVAGRERPVHRTTVDSRTPQSLPPATTINWPATSPIKITLTGKMAARPALSQLLTDSRFGKKRGRPAYKCTSYHLPWFMQIGRCRLDVWTARASQAPAHRSSRTLSSV